MRQRLPRPSSSTRIPKVTGGERPDVGHGGSRCPTSSLLNARATRLASGSSSMELIHFVDASWLRSEPRPACGAPHDRITWTTTRAHVTCPACARVLQPAHLDGEGVPPPGDASCAGPNVAARAPASDAAPRASARELPETELLTRLLERYLQGRPVTSCERVEMLHIAQGFECKDSAMADDVATETIRSRRKRLYTKLEVSGSQEIISSLLALSLRMLADGERIDAGPHDEHLSGARGRVVPGS